MDKNIDDINLIEVLNKIYKSKKIIIYSTFIFFIIGVLISILSPVNYKSQTVFIPQNQESNSSSFSGVASLVGINLPNSLSNEIPSSLYPQIANSSNFKRLLLNKIIDEKKNLTVEDFIKNYYNVKESMSKADSNLFVSDFEEECFKIISNLLTVIVNDKDGYITIIAISPVAEYSAKFANLSKDILQHIIIENKIESAKQNLLFTQKQLKEKRIEFDDIQNKLSYFIDSNLNLVNSSIINEQKKLEAEFEIINSVVTELSKQVETAKLQVKRDTPVFATIDQAFVPNMRNSPKRKQIVFIYSALGFFLSIIFVLIKEPLITNYQLITNKK